MVLNGSCALPEGMTVEVRPRRAAISRKPKAPGASARVRKPVKDAKTRIGKAKAVTTRRLPGFGMWKDREDWRGKSTIEIARELRRKAMGERYLG